MLIKQQSPHVKEKHRPQLRCMHVFICWKRSWFSKWKWKIRTEKLPHLIANVFLPTQQINAGKSWWTDEKVMNIVASLAGAAELNTERPISHPCQQRFSTQAYNYQPCKSKSGLWKFKQVLIQFLWKCRLLSLVCTRTELFRFSLSVA